MKQGDLRSNRILNVVSGVCTIGILIICILLWKSGTLSSEQSIIQSVQGFGQWAPLLFIMLQALQVVIPIMPGGISCLVGVIIFGPLKGFVYNYAGICVGSVIAFLIAKKYGRPILYKMFPEKIIKKYDKWTSERGRFTKMFATAIFLPVAPDDFLCFMAGTTEMRLPVFTSIILLGKPAAIALYSMGLMEVFKRTAALIGG